MHGREDGDLHLLCIKKMNTYEKNDIERLEKMTIHEARVALASKEFGDITSPRHRFCLSWLEAKEAELRDLRESSTLRFARHAAYAAYAAAIIAAISIVITIIMPFAMKSP